MAESYDVIVIGAGHNGLVNAAYLARAGRKVLVLESRPVVGGAAVTEEIVPGFRFSVYSYVVSLLRPEIIRELRLAEHGLEILPLDGTFTPLDGNYLWRTDDHSRTRREIARFSPADAESYEEFGRAMVRICRFVRPLLDAAPPDPASLAPADLERLLWLARRFQALERDDKRLLLQLLTASAADFLDGWFETDVLKATMAASGIIGTFLGIRSPGTAYVLLHHYMGEIDGTFRAWGFSRDGTGGVTRAIAGAACEAGARIRTEARVVRILARGGRAAGVALESGEEIRAPVVSSSLDPRQTFLRLLEPGDLPPQFLDEVRRYKFRGSSGKLNLALDGLPEFTCLPATAGGPAAARPERCRGPAEPGAGRHLRGAISISPGVDYMERAYDDAKYGRFSRRPYIDVVIPTLTDPQLAPPGKHVMSCFVQYAPYALRDGDWDSRRDEFADTVIDTLAEYAPNIRSIIAGRQVITPLDIERAVGMSEGNIFQGELSPEQLFFLRPVAGWARYRTPVRGLYLCGSAAHPGGGIMGAPGRLAAREILKRGPL